MNTRFALAALAAACLSPFAAAQMGPGMEHGKGHGMMGGPGVGRAMPAGPGMGAGMMHGNACDMAPGMRGRRGAALGMRGERAMAALASLNLSGEQRGKVTDIRRDMQRKRHALMGQVHELRWQAEDARKSAELDEAAARKRFEAGAALRKQMFEMGLETRKRIEAVLTKEQREQLQAMRQGPGPAF